MSTEISLNSSILERAGKQLCLLYRKKTCDLIDDVRLQMFLEKYKQFSKKVAKLTNFENKEIRWQFLTFSCRILVQKMKRTMFVARRWTISYIQFQQIFEPCEHGLRLENNKYHRNRTNLPLCDGYFGALRNRLG